MVVVVSSEMRKLSDNDLRWNKYLFCTIWNWILVREFLVFSRIIQSRIRLNIRTKPVLKNEPFFLFFWPSSPQKKLMLKNRPIEPTAAELLIALAHLLSVEKVSFPKFRFTFGKAPFSTRREKEKVEEKISLSLDKTIDNRDWFRPVQFPLRNNANSSSQHSDRLKTAAAAAVAMTSRIVKSALSFGRLRVGSATVAEANTGTGRRLAFSTSVTKSPPSGGPVNAFVRTWYNLYVILFQIKRYIVDFSHCYCCTDC